MVTNDMLVIENSTNLDHLIIIITLVSLVLRFLNIFLINSCFNLKASKWPFLISDKQTKKHNVKGTSKGNFCTAVVSINTVYCSF